MFKRFSGFQRDARANVAATFALSVPVLVFGVGMMVDHGMALRSRERLNSIADAAALEAVSTTGMQLSDDQAKANAKARFVAAAAQLANVKLDAKNVSVVITHPDGAATRSVQVSYGAGAATIFSGLLGVTTLNLSGGATAVSSTSPNIDFYVLLDNSSSMTLPATQDGITLMQTLTPKQNSPVGCAFACHEIDADYNPPGFSKQTVGNPCKPGTSGGSCKQIDNFQLARNNNIVLRFDQVVTAMSALLSTAKSLQSSFVTPPTYKFDVASLNSEFATGLSSVMSLTANYATQWQTSQNNLKIYTVYGADAGCVAVGSDPCGSYAVMDVVNNGKIQSENDVGYMDSKITGALQTMASKVPASGDGSVGGEPQRILFLVTDGVEDYATGSPTLTIGPLSATGQAACTTLKNKNVKVAVLYTTYYPIPGFHTYDNYVAPIITQVEPALKNCATPGLFMTAKVGDDISAALQKLFQLSTGSARLTQ